MELIYGDEPYLVDYELAKARDSHDETETYYAWGSGAKGAILSPPLLGGKKAVILRLPELTEGIGELGDAPCDIYITVEKLDRRRKAFQSLPACRQVACNKISMEMLHSFVLRECSRCSMGIRKDAFRLFLSRIQYHADSRMNLYKVRTYVRQMCFSAKADRLPHIETGHVNGCVPTAIQEQAYHLTDALAHADAKEYMRIATALAMEKDGACLLSSLLRTFRAAYKSALYADKAGKELEGLLRVPAFQYAAVRDLPPPCMQACMDILLAGISEIRSGNPPALCSIKAMCLLWETIKAG